MSLTIKAMNDFAGANQRVFPKSRHRTVGASEIGQCERKIAYLKKSHDPRYVVEEDQTPESFGARSRGTTFEESYWYPAMKAHYGKDLLYAGPHQKTLTVGYLSGTPDALLIHQPKNALADLMVPDIGPSGEVVIDCKTVDPRINLSEPKPEHVFQVQVQLGLFHELTKHRPEYGVLAYYNASFWDDCEEFVIKRDPKIYSVAKTRAERILGAESAAQLAPEGWISGGQECKYCRFTKACGALRSDVPPNELVNSADRQFIEMIADLAREERALAQTIKETEQVQREYQHKIKEELREKGLRKIDDGAISVTWSSVKGRPSYNIPELKKSALAAGIDLREFETVGDPTDRLLITVKSKDRLVK